MHQGTHPACTLCPPPPASAHPSPARPAPEVARHIQALVVAVEHVDCPALLPRLPVQLAQQQHRACVRVRGCLAGCWAAVLVQPLRARRRCSPRAGVPQCSTASRRAQPLPPCPVPGSSHAMGAAASQKQLQLSPISQSPRSSTSPSCTTTVSPPTQRMWPSSSASTPAISRHASAFCRSPWMSPTARVSGGRVGGSTDGSEGARRPMAGKEGRGGQLTRRLASAGTVPIRPAGCPWPFIYSFDVDRSSPQTPSPPATHWQRCGPWPAQTRGAPCGAWA